MIEYALLAGVVALGSIAALVKFSTYFGLIFQAGAASLQGFFPQ